MRIAVLKSRALGCIVLALVVGLSLCLSLAARTPDTGDDPKATLSAAAKKLTERPGYGWKTTVVAGDFGPFGGGGGVTTGQTVKDGYTRVSMPSSGGGRLEFATKGGKAAVMVEGNWQTLEQAAARGGGSPNPFGPPVGFNPSVVVDFKMPAAQAEEYIEKATDFRRDGDTVTGILSADVASELLSAAGPPGFRRPRGGRRPQGGAGPPGGGRRGGGGNPFDAPIRDPKGSVTFRIVDGAIT